MKQAVLVAVFCVAALAAAQAAAAELLLFEKQGCGWCDAWHSTVGQVYHKTDEGRRLPLRRIDVGQGEPEGIVLTRRVVYTPTFVVALCGREVGRITGYPGEANFYGLLGAIIAEIRQDDPQSC